MTFSFDGESEFREIEWDPHSFSSGTLPRGPSRRQDNLSPEDCALFVSPFFRYNK
jgi:hypothetical protein